VALVTAGLGGVPGHTVTSPGGGAGVSDRSWSQRLSRRESADEDQPLLVKCGQMSGSLSGVGSVSGSGGATTGSGARSTLSDAWSCSICRTRSALWRCAGCHRPKQRTLWERHMNSRQARAPQVLRSLYWMATASSSRLTIRALVRATRMTKRAVAESLSKHVTGVTGTLSGFDRLVFCGHAAATVPLRRANGLSRGHGGAAE